MVRKNRQFEITDSKETDACDRLLGGIWYSDNGARIADLGSSGLPDIENFLVRIKVVHRKYRGRRRTDNKKEKII